MFRFRHWFAPPRRLLLSFVIVLLLPATAVLSLGVRIIQQDRELEAQQLVKRRQLVAQRAAAALEAAIAATERQLTSTAGLVVPSGDDAVVVTQRGADDEIQAKPPSHLLFYPTRFAPGTSLLPELAVAERLEFQQRNGSAAAEAYRAIAGVAAKSDVRANALVGLARSLKLSGRTNDALAVYSALARETAATVAGVPADLAARRARVRLLEESGRVAEARKEVATLRVDLMSTRWRLDRGTFLAYVEDPISADRLALSDSVSSFFEQRRTNRDLAEHGRRSIRANGMTVVLLWQSSGDRVVLFAAGPGFVEREWLPLVNRDVESNSIHIALRNDDGGWAYGDPPKATASAQHTSAESGLPWTVVATDIDAAPGIPEFSDRRRMVVAGLAVLVALVVVGGGLTLRAVSRELAVARLQSDFVSAVSHEFRTPLTSLQQFTDMLADPDEPPPNKRRAFYQAQARATERLRRLVESLLDFGRMEAGARPYQQRRIGASDLVRQIADDFQREAAPAGFVIEFTASSAADEIEVDVEAVTCAVWNLLDNAVKYSGTQRTVSVGVFRTEDEVAISVRDHGIGVPVREQKRIFDKFVRGEASRHTPIEGLGIGLAMVRHIIDGHRGRITVQSQPGEGSTFTIALPAAQTGVTNTNLWNNASLSSKTKPISLSGSKRT